MGMDPFPKKITEYNGGLVEIKAHMRAKLCPHMEDSFLFFFLRKIYNHMKVFKEKYPMRIGAGGMYCH